MNEFRHRFDADDVMAATVEEVRPLPGTAAHVGDPAADVASPAADEVSVLRVSRLDRPELRGVLDRPQPVRRVGLSLPAQLPVRCLNSTSTKAHSVSDLLMTLCSLPTGRV